jgi:hypothetical protein
MRPGALDVLISVDQPSLARWVLLLADALERVAGARVFLRLAETASEDEPAALRGLLALERLTRRRGRSCAGDRIRNAEAASRMAEPGDFRPDAIIDLTAAVPRNPPPGAVLLRPLYNGHAGVNALAGALFFDGTPEIAIEQRLPDSIEGVIVAHGFASLEAAGGLGGGMEAVYSRVLTLIVRELAGDGAGAIFSPEAMRGKSVRRIGAANALHRSARMVAAAAARAAYHLCCHPSHWRVGWRFVRPGDDVWSRRDLGGVRWNVLADPVDHFYADPFPLHWQGRDYLFFEDLDYRTGKGIISAVSFDERGRPGRTFPVLEEPWHLSYPSLIEWDGQIWMIPESSANREIAIYRAVDFPLRWEKHAVLVGDVEAADATIAAHDGLLWMFAVTREAIGGYSDTLAIWHAGDLFGPWRAHRANPVLVDDRAARPAGNMVNLDGMLYRPVQDCRAAYGAAVNLMRVTRLDEEGFEQESDGRVAPGPAWPGRRLHTLNYNGRLETVDGFVIRPRVKMLADMVDRRFLPH